MVIPNAVVAAPPDEEYMRQALFLAERGRPTTSPNPMVGCVVVSPEGLVVGRGYHERAGEPHAEVLALRAAGGRARGSTLYVTLEPCSHVGRTGPCVVPIVEAGVARVVAAMVDPNPIVSGRGLAFLREHGIEVGVGVCEQDASRLNETFVTAMTRSRPWVLLKIAASSDGRIAAAPGARTLLTSHPANLFVHRTRAWVDAVMAGAGTVIADDPLLTARLVRRARPLVRVVVDWRLRVPLSARVLASVAEGPVILVSTPEAVGRHPDRVAVLSARGIEVMTPPARDLSAVMTGLHARGVQSVLVEGGATLHRACLQAGLADRLHLFVTPHVLGPAGLAWDVPLPWSAAPARVVPLGPDVLIDTHVHRTH
jgi:diaminohydroxyphosphoribosylaminopyrimidine deaminase/5-amino-6-(5-phosphoribosylamino)uracil reductase